MVGGRELGGSFYAFLKSTQAAEFALDETFRLNAPLTAFPERKFYTDRYVSLVPQEKLALREDWREGLSVWQKAALDPEFPIVVFVHDGPLAATANPFEAKLAAELATALRQRIATETGDISPSEQFWSDVAAVVSPHRAQNATIRAALPEAEREACFVETVDRIQGKERDAIILSYCVSDPEFALAESEFIFSSERLNVAITRARTKLVVFVSRHLLDAVPGEQEIMDKVETLREFIFSCEHKGDLVLEGPAGSQIAVQVRVRGFENGVTEPDLTEVDQAPTIAPTMTPELERVMKAICKLAVENKYGTTTPKEIKKALALSKEPFSECRDLHRLGQVALQQKSGKYGEFWVMKPLAEPRRVFDIDPETVKQRIDQAVRDVRQGTLAPFYSLVRDRFIWMTVDGEDALLPVLKKLQDSGHVTLSAASNGSITIDVPRRRAEPLPEDEAPATPNLSDDDFRILNKLEDIEAKRINFGVLDGWISAALLATGSRFSVTDVTASLARLEAGGYVLLAEDGRIRSRMAELAREVRHVKQRFKVDDADERPYLVRSLKLELRDRDKPVRDVKLAPLLSTLAELNTEQASSINGVLQAIQSLWGADAQVAGFQARGFEAVMSAWRGEGPPGIVFAADTGSGKTEAAILPMIAAAAADRLAGILGVRAILTYPRVRLVANQAQRLTSYLAALSKVPGMPLVTIGMQVGQVPRTFGQLQTWDHDAGWDKAGPDAVTFPFFGCPKCGEPLHLYPSDGLDGADALVCTLGDWRFDGWIGSKEGLVRVPPAFFLPTADSLHQWLHDPQNGVLFGDDHRFAAPRALLADEIHLYTHIHGAQVGLALRRLAARAELNADDGRRLVTIGMSATLGDPAEAWGRLIGHGDLLTISPTREEMDPNPRGREYFYFIQPEVESRGKDIAGASTTIQSLMCLAHGMRRRTGNEGGFRSLAFLDSIDKLRRMHSAYLDAEEGRELASLRTCNYADDPSGAPRTACCKDPVGCDRYSEGECWWFAANDESQRTAIGRVLTGANLKVASKPIFSGTGGDVEKLIKDSDIVFATSSLEVGYDDPDITLVYQHYAPQNLASFIQRKGRGGRGTDDRPITAVTLSIYSPRDTWWFRRPHEMIAPVGFEIPLNPDNYFVRRGQAVCAALDAMARAQVRGTRVFGEDGLPTDVVVKDIEALALQLFGVAIWSEFSATDFITFWKQATGGVKFYQLARTIREGIAWAPNLLFDTINLPSVLVKTAEERPPQKEDISLVLSTVAPGNATRRFDASAVYWRFPTQGRAPWFDPPDYASAHWEHLFTSTDELLSELPRESHKVLAGADPRICRPVSIRLERLGRIFGAGWTSEWLCDSAKVAVRRADGGRDFTAIKHESRGTLRGFLIVKADPSVATQLDHSPISKWVSRIDSFIGTGAGSSKTGLSAAHVYWGADAEVRMEDPKSDPVAFTQTFVDPTSKRSLLHGYQVETEGLRFQLEPDRLDAFIAEEIELLKSDEPERRWRASQYMRFMVESRAQSMGINAYEARRGADLIVAAAGDPELRKKLLRLLDYWDADKFSTLLEETRSRLLSQHPLMSQRRVARTAETLGNDAFKDLVKVALEELKKPEAMAAYLRSAVLHGLSIRLRESFIHIGRGDERRVLAHVKLPIQFSNAREDTITICEAGAHGDGTTRGVVAHLSETLSHWKDGFIGGCPNAEEDEIIKRFWAMAEKHSEWRVLDPREPETVKALARGLGMTGDDPTPPATILRILYDAEVIGPGRFELYGIAREVETIRIGLEAGLGRYAQDWELTSAAVSKATASSSQGALAKLHAAYAGLDDTVEDESLSADARLADQVYRIGARLCADGCRGCVHQASEMMSDSLVEVTVSRRMLNRFLYS
jgi:hypothetical protein